MAAVTTVVCDVCSKTTYELGDRAWLHIELRRPTIVGTSSAAPRTQADVCSLKCLGKFIDDLREVHHFEEW